LGYIPRRLPLGIEAASDMKGYEKIISIKEHWGVLGGNLPPWHR